METGAVMSRRHVRHEWEDSLNGPICAHASARDGSALMFPYNTCSEDFFVEMSGSFVAHQCFTEHLHGTPWHLSIHRLLSVCIATRLTVQDG